MIRTHVEVLSRPPERTRPKVTVGNVRRLLAGEAKCEWAAWFLWRYDVPPEIDPPYLVEWKREHSALVAERTAYLEAQHYNVSMESENWLDAIGSLTGTRFIGKPDIAIIEPDLLTYEDCKTGDPCHADEVQLLLYTQIARLRGVRKRIACWLVYPDGRTQVDMRDRVPMRDRFVALIGRFSGGTISTTPHPFECGRCKVRAYCCDRVMEPDRTNWEPLFDERR